MKEYEINSDTLAVIGLSDTRSKVLEGKYEYIIEKPAYEIMDDSCRYFGSSYQGRLDGAKNILDCRYKLPIIVEESNQIIFFPIESPLLPKCCWLSLHNYRNHRVNNEKRQTEIVFKNGRVLQTKISSTSINNQILRASRLESIINSRKIY